MATYSAEYIKDPNAVLDFPFNWGPSTGNAGYLAVGETIATSTFITSPAGLTVDSSSHNETSATVWLSGGTDQASYRVTNRITTSQGRTDDRSIIIRVYEK